MKQLVKHMESPLLIGAAYLLSFWPIWQWYVCRMLDGADEPYGILACIACIIIAALKLRKKEEIGSLPIAVLIACLLLYCVTESFMPPLILAIIAVSGVSISLSKLCTNRYFQPGIIILGILSLPVIASLQFYGGYPIRVCTAELVRILLRFSGTLVESEGTVLRWAGELVAIDAPCAGIKMLWSGMFTNAVFIAWMNYSWRMSVLASALTSIMVFSVNVIRSYVLFYRETGLYEVPLSHEGVGLVLFFILLQCICFLHVIFLRRFAHV